MTKYFMQISPTGQLILNSFTITTTGNPPCNTGCWIDVSSLYDLNPFIPCGVQSAHSSGFSPAFS